MTPSLVGFAILKGCTSSKSGDTKVKSSVLASLGGGEADRLLIAHEMQSLIDDDLVTESFSATRVQRSRKGDTEIAKLGEPEFAKQVDMRILAEVPEKTSTESVGFELLAKCLGVLSVPDGRKKIQDLIDARYLDLVAQDRLRRTTNGDLEHKKRGRPFQRKK